MTAPEPVFEAPWHAQAFAVAVHLNERGQFTWPEWATVFSETLAEHGAHKDLNGGDDNRPMRGVTPRAPRQRR